MNLTEEVIQSATNFYMHSLILINERACRRHRRCRRRRCRDYPDEEDILTWEDAIRNSLRVQVMNHTRRYHAIDSPEHVFLRTIVISPAKKLVNYRSDERIEVFFTPRSLRARLSCHDDYQVIWHADLPTTYVPCPSFTRPKTKRIGDYLQCNIQLLKQNG